MAQIIIHNQNKAVPNVQIVSPASQSLSLTERYQNFQDLVKKSNLVKCFY